jgi:FkbM family methyltransferase
MNIIQIGCNNGDDEIFDMIINNDIECALLIDANPYVLELARKKYDGIKNVVIENILVTTHEHDATFIIPHFDAHPYSVHSSLYKDHIIKHNHDYSQVKEITLKGQLLENIIKEYNLLDIDYLMIDCEGEDLNILNSLTFDGYCIREIKFEYSHFTDVEVTLPRLIKKLKDDGYDDPIMVDGNCIVKFI